MFQHCNTDQFRSLNYYSNSTATFGITSFEIEKAISVTVGAPCRKMAAQIVGVDALDPMPASFEQTKTFILKIPRLHRTLTHAKKPNFMIQLDAKLDVPFLPDLARAFGQFGVFLIRSVSGTDNLADIG